MKDIKLGLKPFDKKKQETLFESLKKYFPIKENTLYFPYLDFFSNRCKNKILNSKYTLQKLVKKRGRVGIHGKIFRGIIKSKNRTYTNNLFIKECPIIELLNYYYLLNNYECSLLPSRNNELYEIINSVENSAYIDVMCCHLSSKLVENGLCPSFPKFNGTCATIFKEYTFDITADFELYKGSGILEDEEHFSVYDNKKGTFVKCFNFPVQLLATEYVKINIDDIPKIDEDFIKSITFQIIFALSMAQKYFSIIHNDLHLGNIMFVPTKKKYIYYRYEDTYFRVPTWGYLVKIIDWDRGTFEIKDNTFLNNCYRNNGIAFGQYFLPCVKYQKKKIINPNKSFDLCIYANSILRDYDLDTESNIFKLLNVMASDEKGVPLYKLFDDFELYTHIAKNIDHAVPESKILDPCFDSYLLDKSLIPLEEMVYNNGDNS